MLDRRPMFRETLAPYEPVLAAWADWPGAAQAEPLEWDAAACRARWEAGVPLLGEVPLPVRAEDVEAPVEQGLAALAAAGVEPAALQRFADAWDRGAIGPSRLLPQPGRIGSIGVVAETALPPEAVGFLACAGLRPALETFLAPCRAHLAPGSWEQGVCPFCGAPPAFSDLTEDGRRLLGCHLCGGAWPFPRLRCPFCGSERAADFVRLLAEARDEGWGVWACRGCQGCVKEIDRRVRWNAGPALVEDWGSPHLDLVAERAGYWRAVPTLMQVRPGA